MLAANPIALTHWRLFRRGAMMPGLLLFGGGAILAVVSGLWGMARPGATADITRSLLGWQLVALVLIPPLFAATTVARARQSGTLATDRNSPVRPHQLVLGYLSAALAPAAVIAVPGLVGIAILSPMSGGEAHIGWFAAQLLAATTGALLALCTTVGLLIAQKSRLAIVAGGALGFMAFTMGFEPDAVTGLLLPSTLIAEVAYGHRGVEGSAVQMLGIAWATQLAVAGFAWLAGVRALDPRRDRRAMRAPLLAMIGALWAIQLAFVSLTSLGAWGAEEMSIAMLPITLVLLLGSGVDAAAWSRAIRADGHTRDVSLVPFALGLAAVASIGMLLLVPARAETYHSVYVGMILGTTIVLVSMAAFADASTLLATRTRNLLVAALAFGLLLVPFMVSVLAGNDDLMLLSPVVAIPALMFETHRWDDESMFALVTSLVFLGICFGIRQHAVGQASSAPKRVVGER